MASASTAKDRGEAQPGCVGCLAIALLLIVVSSLLTSQKAHPGASASDVLRDRSSMAVVQCQGFVQDRLRSPELAAFPRLDHSVTRTLDETYTVRSYVDAWNGLGAATRVHYSCTLHFAGWDDADPRNWTLLNLSLG